MRGWLVLLGLAALAVCRKEVVCPGFDIRNTPGFIWSEQTTDMDPLATEEEKAERYRMLINNCTVVEGNVRIIMITNDSVRHEMYPPLPEIREITGSLLIFQVKGLRTLRDVLPNLRVIGGRDLISNYALVIYQNRDLENIGLLQLREIRRGRVRIQDNSQLCGADDFDWAAITSEPNDEANRHRDIRGNNEPDMCDSQCHPPPGKKADWDRQCHTHYKKVGMDTHLHYACLSKASCQPMCSDKCHTAQSKSGCSDFLPSQCCDEECAGGCSGTGPSACFACRHVFHDGECLRACPPNLFLFEGRRCVNQTSCERNPERPQYLKNPGFYKAFPATKTKAAVCTTQCPKDYMEHPEDPRRCVLCNGPCKKHCRPDGEPIVSREGLESLKDCQVVEGNVTIQVTSGINENLGVLLEESVGQIMEIQGFLAIISNPPLVSLSAFKNLRRITGDRGLYMGKYALVVNENENLRMLFPHTPGRIVEIGSRSAATRPIIMVHNNPLLCYSEIIGVARNNSWVAPTGVLDSADVSKTSNGDKTICVKSNLVLGVIPLSDTVILSWDAFNDSDIDHRNFLGYKLYYKLLEETEVPDMFQGRDACNDAWQFYYMRPEERGDMISGLKPNSRYAFYIKTAISHHQGAQGAISDIVVVRTLFHVPSAPIIIDTTEKESNIIIKFSPPAKPHGVVTHYKVTYTKLEDRLPEKRDYCENAAQHSVRASQDAAEAAAVAAEAKAGMCMGIDLSCCPAVAVDNTTCAGGSCAAKDPKGLINTKENQNDIEFENAVHNRVFMEQCDLSAPLSERLENRDCYWMGKLKSRIKTKGGERPGQSSDEKRRRRRRSIDGPEEEKPPSTTAPAPKAPPESVTFNISAMSNGGSIPHETLVLPHKSKTLAHYTNYRIEIWACQDVLAENNYCSESPVISTARTLFIDKMNMVTGLEKTVRSTEGKETEAAENGTEVSARAVEAYMISFNKPPSPNGPMLVYRIMRELWEDGRNSSSDHVIYCLSWQKYNETGGYLFKNPGPGNWSIKVAAESLGGRGPWSSRIFAQFEAVSPFTPLVIGLIVLGAIVLTVFVALTAAILAKKHFIKQMPGYIVQFVSSNMDYIQTTEVYTKDDWEIKRDDVDLKEELGSGTFGKVFLGEGRDASTKAPIVNRNGIEFGPCAVKTVKEGGSPMERLHFLLEANVMKQFDTEFIVKLLGVVSEGQPTLVVMELMEDGNLRDYLRSRRPGAEENTKGMQAPSLQECFQWALMIADGMAYLEARKFVHRDLAARNCMVGSDGSVKIGDFGMARDIYVTDYYRPEGVRKMPVRHMSPESLIDHKFSSKSDVWAYGIVLWEIATLGQQPYMGLGPEDILPFVGRDRRTMDQPVGCPNELYDLMKMCWNYERRHRPSFFKILGYVLRQATMTPSFQATFEKASFYCSAECGGRIDGTVADEEGTGGSAEAEEEEEVGSLEAELLDDAQAPLNPHGPPSTLGTDAQPPSAPICNSNRRSPSWTRASPPPQPSLHPALPI